MAKKGSSMFLAQTMMLGGGYSSATSGRGPSYSSQIHAWENTQRQAKNKPPETQSLRSIPKNLPSSVQDTLRLYSPQAPVGMYSSNVSGMTTTTSFRSGGNYTNKPTSNLTGLPIRATGNKKDVMDIYSNLSKYDRSLLQQNHTGIWTLYPSGNITGIPQQYVAWEKGLPVNIVDIEGYMPAGSLTFENEMPGSNPDYDQLWYAEDKQQAAVVAPRPPPSMFKDDEKLSSDSLQYSIEKETSARKRARSQQLYGKSLLGG